MTTDSRVRAGTLTIGTKSWETQASNVRITPAHDEDGDALELLDGTELPAAKKRTDVLGIITVQDFDDPQGFVAYTWTNDLQVVAFTWKPSGATGPTYAGQVEVLACEVGGDVGVRLTTECEWAIVGAVTVTPATPPGD